MIGLHDGLSDMSIVGYAMQHDPMPRDHAERMMFSPSRPQSICETLYVVSLAMNITHGASLKMVFGLSARLSSFSRSIRQNLQEKLQVKIKLLQ